MVEVCNKSSARLRRQEREPPKLLGSDGICTDFACMGSSRKYCLSPGVRKSGSLAGGLLRTLETQVQSWSRVSAALGLRSLSNSLSLRLVGKKLKTVSGLWPASP